MFGKVFIYLLVKKSTNVRKSFHLSFGSDIDECKEKTAQCGPGTACVNTKGSYKCVPASGSKLDPNKNDEDECANLENPCGPRAICLNTPGSYRCGKFISIFQTFQAKLNSELFSFGLSLAHTNEFVLFDM